MEGRVKYQCEYCQKIVNQSGKPIPGMCLRRPRKDNKAQPHKWVKIGQG